MDFTYKSNPFKTEDGRTTFLHEVKNHFKFFGEDFNSVQVLFKERIELVIPNSISDEVIDSIWVIDKLVYELEFSKLLNQ